MTEEVKITESGMTFVLPKEKLFYIEPYAQQNDFKLKTVEFVWWENNEMRFIEAKSSAPNAKSGNCCQQISRSSSRRIEQFEKLG